jgi:glycosyltransferase involved in cell wall biosynthesis
MKILWFANTPCLASEILNPSQLMGGWLKSLNENLSKREDIELAVCFYHHQEMKPFEYKNTTFYPVFRNYGKKILGKVLNRLKQHTDDKTEIKRLLNVIELVKPDIIHIHGTEENFGLIQAHTKIPVVISIQGIISPYFEKLYAGIPRHAVRWYEPLKDKLLFLSYDTDHYKVWYRAKREQKMLTSAQHIIGRTDWDRRVTRVLAPESDYYTLNEILRPEFYVSAWKKTQFDNPVKLITTTGGGLNKGIETVVKTAQLLVRNATTVRFEWQIIGLSADNTLVKIVKNWLKVDFNRLHIKFLGEKKPDEIVDLLLKSDIYCQVSHIENSPNSLCEAMLSGIPCIASYAGGTGSMLNDKNEGILIQDGEPYSYAGAIIELTNHFQTAQSMGRNAKITAEKRHDENKITNELIDIYHKLRNR